MKLFEIDTIPSPKVKKTTMKIDYFDLSKPIDIDLTVEEIERLRRLGLRYADKSVQVERRGKISVDWRKVIHNVLEGPGVAGDIKDDINYKLKKAARRQGDKFNGSVSLYTAALTALVFPPAYVKKIMDKLKTKHSEPLSKAILTRLARLEKHKASLLKELKKTGVKYEEPER